MPALEIEQKFVYDLAIIGKRILECNGKYLGCKTFLDTYYDFKERKLALTNIWLRKRQSTWELKVGNIPKVDPDNMKGLGTTYYVETEGETSISKALDAYPFFPGSTTFEDKLSRLQPLAIIETTRTSYRLNNHTKIDLDDARLIPTQDMRDKMEAHYSIGEIEIMVNDENELHVSHSEQVEREMGQIRKMLGIETSIHLMSKIDKYFLEFMPVFYKTYPYKTYHCLLMTRLV